MNLIEAEIVDGGAQIGDYLVPIARDVLAKAGDDKGIHVHLAPDPKKLHLFSTSTEERLVA
jgi:multiple sugar transport system ATP-binding protein